MTNVPEFHFDFDAVKGKDFTEALQTLMKQMEAHYNEHIKPAPILFGAVPIPPPQVTPTQIVDTIVGPPELKQPAGTVPPTDTLPENVMEMESWEIRPATELGLKDGYVMDGVNKKGVAIFDVLKKGFGPKDLYVEGDSGAYHLEPKK